MKENDILVYSDAGSSLNLRGINRLRDEKGGFKLGGSRVENNRKNVAWQTKQQLLRMIDDHEAAVAAQDSADNKRIMNWELQQSMDSLNDMFNEDGSLKAFDNIL